MKEGHLMKRNGLYLSVFVLFFAFSSCFVKDEYSEDPRKNFEALWKLIDEHYCFFGYKNIDWNAMYDKYSAQVNPAMDAYQLFNLLGKMLAELKDGHTNLTSSFNTSRFWNWYDGYPDNFNDIVHQKYLGADFYTIGGFMYKVMRDQIGYIYYRDFSSYLNENYLDEIFLHFNQCSGLIIDIRNNSGGSLTNSERFAARFITEKTIVGYIMHKTGKGHNDLSSPYVIELEPSKRIKWLKSVVVITNRRCFSAANDFVNKMKLFPQVTIIGDQTGGGCGLLFHAELPNGWSVRISSSPILDAYKAYTEYGVEPDIKINIKESDQLNNIDTILETALDFLL